MCFNGRMEELRDLPRLEIPAAGLAGIYFLFWKGRLQYVGKSTNVYFRVARHWALAQQRRRGLIRTLERDRERPELYLDFDEVRVKFCSADLIAHEEFLAIKRYSPPHNIQLTRELPKNLGSIQRTDWFQKLVKVADEVNPNPKRRKFTGNPRPIARAYNKQSTHWRSVREAQSV